jgi:hypothetical protein
MHNPNPGFQSPMQDAPVRPASTYAAAMEVVTTKVGWIGFACRNLTAQISAFTPYPETNRLYQLRSEFVTNYRYIIDTLLVLKRDLEAWGADPLLHSPSGSNSREKNEYRTVARDLKSRLIAAVAPVDHAIDQFSMNFGVSMAMCFMEFDISPQTLGSAMNESPEAFQASMLQWAPGQQEEISRAYQNIAAKHIDYYQMRAARIAISNAFEPVIRRIDAIPRLDHDDVLGDDGLNYTQRWWRNCAIASVTFTVGLGVILGIALGTGG